MEALGIYAESEEVNQRKKEDNSREHERSFEVEVKFCLLGFTGKPIEFVGGVLLEGEVGKALSHLIKRRCNEGSQKKRSEHEGYDLCDITNG